MPSQELLAEMGSLQRGAGQGGRDARRRGPPAELEGRAGRFSGDERTVIDGPFAETKELIAGYWMWQVELDGGGGRVGQALPQPDGRAMARSRSARCSRPRTSATSSRPSCASSEERLRAGAARQPGAERAARLGR